MRSDNDCRPFVEHLQREHHRLAELLSQTQAAFARWAASQQEAASFVETLVQLRDELDRHYAEEEAGGCLEEAQCRCPSLSEEVKRIEAEHQELRREMNRLVEQAGELAKRAEGAASLEQGLSEFLSRVRRHEAAENRILVYGFGSEALDEFSEEPNQLDAGPCACGAAPADGNHQVNLQE